ncbi:hypothetical protein BC829DRAFT_457666 [Chytridium lagenaria]|nr:hypothetical protein BC829DRAFT_457666 [Chytridium lagenaria]
MNEGLWRKLVEGTNLHVGGLEWFGKVVEGFIMTEKGIKKSAGFGFVTYKSKVDAAKAIAGPHDPHLAGLKVKLWREREKAADKDTDDKEFENFSIGFAHPTKTLQTIQTWIPPRFGVPYDTVPKTTCMRLSSQRNVLERQIWIDGGIFKIFELASKSQITHILQIHIQVGPPKFNHIFLE